MERILKNFSQGEVKRLLAQQAALAEFGSFAFREPDLLKIQTEAARICANSLGVPFCKICRYRPRENDLLIEAGCGWKPGVLGRVVSQADESSPQGRAYVTGEPVIIRNIYESNDLSLPSFYAEHGIISTVDVLIPGIDGPPYGVLEIDSADEHTYNEHDIAFLTGFANVLAEAVATSMRIKRLEALVKQKEMLAEGLQHRVRNNLQLVNNMLESYSRTADVALTRSGIDSIVRRVTSLAKVYDLLLGSGLSRTIDFGEYLQALCVTLPKLQGETHRTAELVCRTEPMLVDLDTVTALGMAVAELVTNSYGHAFPDGHGTITVTLAGPDADGVARLTISDDGIGFKAGGETKRRGLGLVRRLIEQADATLEMSSNEGTTWLLTFAVPDGTETVLRAA